MFPSNPFATRAVRPGAIDYLFAEGESLPRLMERFETSGRWGQIIGPHGSGKSTLLATLLSTFVTNGRNIVEFSLHDGERRLPVRLSSLQEIDANTIIAVDGYEQLSRWHRFWLKRFCRRCGCGLIVTAHESVGLPELYRTTTSVELAEQLVNRLLPDDNWTVSGSDLEGSFVAHRGNLREVFFDLYDLYQRSRV